MAILDIRLSPQTASLIGLARKAHTVEQGFEAVRRGLLRRKVALIMVDEGLAENSLKKINTLSRKTATVVLRVRAKDSKLSLTSITGYKVVGLHRGGLLNGFVEKLKQENQWQ